MLVEVKPLRSLENYETVHRLDCVAAYLERSDRAFVILTDAAIRQEPRLSNLRWVYHQASRVPPSQEAGAVAVWRHRNHFPLRMEIAVTLLRESGVNPYSLLMAGQLRCELGQAISMDTNLTLATEADHGWFWISRRHGF